MCKGKNCQDAFYYIDFDMPKKLVGVRTVFNFMIGNEMGQLSVTNDKRINSVSIYYENGEKTDKKTKRIR